MRHGKGGFSQGDLTKSIQWYYILNPLLFIRGLSCPSCSQASLSLNCLKLTLPRFPYNCFPASCDDIGFLKNPRSSIGLEIRPQSAFSAFRALLPSANYSAEWSGRVWQTSADSNGCLAHYFCQQRLSHLTQKVQIQTKMAPNCHYYLQRAVTPDWMGSSALW